MSYTYYLHIFDALEAFSLSLYALNICHRLTLFSKPQWIGLMVSKHHVFHEVLDSSLLASTKTKKERKNLLANLQNVGNLVYTKGNKILASM